MRKKTVFLSLGLLSALCIIAAAALQTVAMFLSYETETHYFAPDAPLPVVAVVCALLAAVLGIVIAFLVPKAELSPSPFSDRILPSMPAAFGCVICGSAFLGASGGLGKLGAIALLIAAIGFVLCGSPLRHSIPNIIALLGFAPVIGCALINAYYYFDVSIEMNAPVKVMLQTALLFSMLYFTAELRFLIGRARPTLYLILAFCSASACSLCAVSVPVAYAAGLLTRLDYVLSAFFALGTAITILCRVFHLLSPIWIQPCPAPDALLTDTVENPEDTQVNTDSAEAADETDATAIPHEPEDTVPQTHSDNEGGQTE